MSKSLVLLLLLFEFELFSFNNLFMFINIYSNKLLSLFIYLLYVRHTFRMLAAHCLLTFKIDFIFCDLVNIIVVLFVELFILKKESLTFLNK